MSIRTFLNVVIVILSASNMHVAVATEVLNSRGDMFEAESGGRLRADSWSERPEVSRAIEAYKTEVERLVDLFETGGEVWRSVSNVCEGQPFIGDKKIGDKDYVDNASNTRFMYIQDVQKYLKRLQCGIELLNSVKIREKDIGALPAEKSASLASFLKEIHVIDGESITGCFYTKVNDPKGMRAYGMSFSTVVKSEWKGENALTRFGKIIGNPGAKIKGRLQQALEALLLTIDIKTS